MELDVDGSHRCSFKRELTRKDSQQDERIGVACNPRYALQQCHLLSGMDT